MAKRPGEAAADFFESWHWPRFSLPPTYTFNDNTERYYLQVSFSSLIQIKYECYAYVQRSQPPIPTSIQGKYIRDRRNHQPSTPKECQRNPQMQSKRNPMHQSRCKIKFKTIQTEINYMKKYRSRHRSKTTNTYQPLIPITTLDATEVRATTVLALEHVVLLSGAADRRPAIAAQQAGRRAQFAVLRC